MTEVQSRIILKIGNSAGVTLPAEMMKYLGLEIGDSVDVTLTEQGILLSPNDPDFEKAQTLSDEVMKDYDQTLKGLA